jgi:hypothetical protein
MHLRLDLIPIAPVPFPSSGGGDFFSHLISVSLGETDPSLWRQACLEGHLPFRNKIVYDTI